MFYTSVYTKSVLEDIYFQKLLTKDNSSASQQPFVLGTYTAGPALSMDAMTGYKMDYTQVQINPNSVAILKGALGQGFDSFTPF